MFNIPLHNFTKFPALPKFDVRNRNIEVGVLGGSFNPAHQGHIHISNMVRKKYHLKEIWWFVTPQNPIKSSLNTAPLEQRLAYAKKITLKHKHIKVFASEQYFGKNFTAQTIRHLKNRNNRVNFHWIIGSDNAYQMHKWVGYQQIISQINIIVFHRPKYIKQLGFKPVMKQKNVKVVTGKLHPLSSTAIRNGYGNANS